MSVGKSSISRLSQAAKEPVKGGIRSLAPEVPAGDAAVPPAEVKSTEKKASTKGSTGTKKSTGTTSTAKKAPAAAKATTEVKKVPTFEIGDALPYWLL